MFTEQSNEAVLMLGLLISLEWKMRKIRLAILHFQTDYTLDEAIEILLDDITEDRWGVEVKAQQILLTRWLESWLAKLRQCIDTKY